MFNPFAMFFLVIDITEPPVTDDDTAPYFVQQPVPEPAPITLHPFVFMTPDQMLGALAAYRPNNLSAWEIGHITEFRLTRWQQIEFLFKPENERLPAKWRHVSEFKLALRGE